MPVYKTIYLSGSRQSTKDKWKHKDHTHTKTNETGEGHLAKVKQIRSGQKITGGELGRTRLKVKHKTRINKIKQRTTKSKITTKTTAKTANHDKSLAGCHEKKHFNSYLIILNVF